MQQYKKSSFSHGKLPACSLTEKGPFIGLNWWTAWLNCTPCHLNRRYFHFSAFPNPYDSLETYRSYVDLDVNRHTASMIQHNYILESSSIKTISGQMVSIGWPVCSSKQFFLFSLIQEQLQVLWGNLHINAMSDFYMHIIISYYILGNVLLCRHLE